MSQMNLMGGSRQVHLCIHCSYIGYGEYIKECPKCGWVCYKEADAKKLLGVYPIFDRKLKRL